MTLRLYYLLQILGFVLTILLWREHYLGWWWPGIIAGGMYGLFLFSAEKKYFQKWLPGDFE